MKMVQDDSRQPSTMSRDITFVRAEGFEPSPPLGDRDLKTRLTVQAVTLRPSGGRKSKSRC
jgi:hypothetical protein